MKATGTAVRNSSKICAMQVINGEDGTARMGALTQLSRDAILEVCGPGFNERTVKVAMGGHFYFVFREDLEFRSEPRRSNAN